MTASLSGKGRRAACPPRRPLGLGARGAAGRLSPGSPGQAGGDGRGGSRHRQPASRSGRSALCAAAETAAHCFPFLVLSAIKAVGVASSPLGPPLPPSPRRGHCPARLWGGRQGARPPASKEQRAAGPGSAHRPQPPRPPPPLVCNGTFFVPLSSRRLCFSSVPCDPHPMTIVRFVSAARAELVTCWVFFQPSWPYLFQFSQCFQPVR